MRESLLEIWPLRIGGDTDRQVGSSKEESPVLQTGECQFYGMISAYEESDYGEQAFTEQHIINTFVSTATDVVMLQGRDMPIEFSIGHLFGYFRGCTLIGTPAFDEWVERDGISA